MNYLSTTKFYILACSGGPDSMALFKMLLDDGYDFAVAFVNYHKRVESDIEQKAVKEYCQTHNKKFFFIEPKKKNSSGNFQAWARDVRYEFFYKLAKELHADGILVAHQKDDLLETYILQKNRGGIYSYYGLKDIILYKDVPIIRPLLEYRKKDLQNFCIKNNVPYFIDSSNLKNDYERNKIRHNVIEFLKEDEITNLINEINSQNILNEKYKIEVKSYIDKCNDNYQISEFASLSPEVQKMVIHYVLNEFDLKYSGYRIEAIKQFILSKKTNNILPLNKNLNIYKNYGYWEIGNIMKMNYKYFINEPMLVENDLFIFDLINGKDNFYIKDDSFPLEISIAPQNEKVKIGTLYKKINRVFIDDKIPMKLRNIWPCIKDKYGKLIFLPRKKDIFKIDDNGVKHLIFTIKKSDKIN